LSYAAYAGHGQKYGRWRDQSTAHNDL